MRGLGVLVICFLLVVAFLLLATPQGRYLMSEPLSLLRQRQLHETAYRTSLRPGAAWVSSFLDSHDRLPTQVELNEFVSSNGLHLMYIRTNESMGEAAWKNPGKDFILSAPVNDWHLYYRSWDKKEYRYWTD
jgi:hypothetical protein